MSSTAHAGGNSQASALGSSRPDELRVPSRARWVAVVLLVVYGFAKLNGSQFTSLDSELTRPMGQVSGFWLTWYYFGYSPIYGAILGLVQIGGAVLLAFRRTALLGALLLLPVVGNIVLIDVFYAIDPGALTVAVVILLCLLGVVAPYRSRLAAAVLLDVSPHRLLPRAAAVAAVLAGAWAFTYWVANYNNRAPTPIDGIWSVTATPGERTPQPHLARVFFEYNRAHLVVLRRSDGTDERHHFEVGPDGRVQVWEQWLQKGELIMDGRMAGADAIELSELRSGARVVLHRETAPH
jgi:hypothetical protein